MDGAGESSRGVQSRMESLFDRMDSHCSVMESRIGKGYRYFIMVGGVVLLISGIAMIPFPGPGSLLAMMGATALAVKVPLMRKWVLTVAQQLDKAGRWIVSHGWPAKVGAWSIVVVTGTGITYLYYFFLAPSSVSSRIGFLPVNGG